MLHNKPKSVGLQKDYKHLHSDYSKSIKLKIARGLIFVHL